MMYPYMILADETEIVHSQIIEKDGMKKVLTITIGENESAKYWMTVLNELKQYL